LHLTLEVNVVYAILAAIVACVFIVYAAIIVKMRYEFRQGHDLDTTKVR
jgi:hypothetical protein